MIYQEKVILILYYLYASFKSLSEILGHASVNITLNRYVHPSMELKQKNMNKLSGFLTTK